MSMSVTTTRIPAPTTTFIGNPNITTSSFRTSANAPSGIRFRNSRFEELFPALYVGDALLVALDHDFGALFDGPAILTARSGTAAAASEWKYDFSSSAFTDGHADSAKRADDAPIGLAQWFIGRPDKLDEGPQNNPACGDSGHGGNARDEESLEVRVIRHQIANATKPREKGENGGSVEPGDLRAGTVAGTVRMWHVEMNMQLNGKMQMHDARQKRKNAERDAKEETKEIHVGPGHTAPHGATSRLRREVVARLTLEREAGLSCERLAVDDRSQST